MGGANVTFVADADKGQRHVGTLVPLIYLFIYLMLMLLYFLLESGINLHSY